MNLRTLLILSFLSFSLMSLGQWGGDIIQASTSSPNPLDPNNDGFITNTGSSFTSGALEYSQFELPWSPMQLLEEPSGDGKGSTCGPSDVVRGDGGGQYSVAYSLVHDPTPASPNSGDELFMFRIRTAKQSTGSFGYSILVDKDNKFADDDPNKIAGNPGFELEIRVNSNSGVFVDNIDGTTSPTNLASYPGLTNVHIAKAADRWLDPNFGCSAPANNNYPVFYDFWVPMSVLGISSSDTVKLVPSTSQSGNSVLGGSASDITGVDDNSNSNQDSLFIDVIDSYPDETLPVELVGFEADLENGIVYLNWTTASELNNDYFEIERSLNGHDYETIGRVIGQGNSNQISSYSYEDNYQFNGLIYYRLKQVDFDGTTSYSNLISVNKTHAFQNEGLTIYPNPSSNGSTIRIDMPNENEIQSISLYNTSGKQLLAKDGEDSPSYLLSLYNIKKGMYFIKVLSENGMVYQKKLIIN